MLAKGEDVRITSYLITFQIRCPHFHSFPVIYRAIEWKESSRLCSAIPRNNIWLQNLKEAQFHRLEKPILWCLRSFLRSTLSVEMIAASHGAATNSLEVTVRIIKKWISSSSSLYGAWLWTIKVQQEEPLQLSQPTLLTCWTLYLVQFWSIVFP